MADDDGEGIDALVTRRGDYRNKSGSPDGANAVGTTTVGALNRIKRTIQAGDRLTLADIGQMIKCQFVSCDQNDVAAQHQGKKPEGDQKGK